MTQPTLHFISGLLRSGSTLLGALLRQNPRFHASMSSPVGGLVTSMLEAMSADADKAVIFDTNRLWCSKLPLIH